MSEDIENLAEIIEGIIEQYEKLTAQYGAESIMKLLTVRCKITKEEFLQNISSLWDGCRGEKDSE